MKRKSFCLTLLCTALMVAPSGRTTVTVLAEEPESATEVAADTAGEAATDPVEETATDLAEETATDSTGEADANTAALSRVSVHDPSIVKADGIYYVLGSHTASAKSTDLMHWEQINFDYGNVANTPFYGNLDEMLAEPFAWAGHDDGDCIGGYAVWAPDAIWNPYYLWDDGSTGAYMIYFCASSTWRRSCIGYLVAKDFTGPYEYVDTIIYSGFTKTGEPDGNSTRDTRWDNDYLNLNELLAKGSANGGIDEISDNWFTSVGGWENNYAPNAIDPNLFFDASGETLYLSYGSWSGGLFLLELDRETGEALYPGVDSVDTLSGNFVDRYFGLHLAGGNHQSGEAPYIQYDPETNYYYLYETYGGLTAEGGYNMRLFRSENPQGPYLDAAGQNAADNGANNDLYGIKLIGNYSFYDQMGKRAAGHNSVLIDDDGARYLVYHQRFDIEPQLEAHEVRVHQQFLNEDLWPAVAVYEYQGETPAHYEDAEVVGSYEFINHGKKTAGTMLDTLMLNLNEDGTVSGALEGTWSKTDSQKGYDYVTIQTEEVTYKGFFFRQKKENNEPEAVMTFSAIGNDNTCIWGSMIDTADTEMMANMAAIAIGQMLPTAVHGDIELPTSVLGSDVSWTTSDASVVSESGKVTLQDKDAYVKLTAAITCGDTSITNDYKMVVRRQAALTYGFDFESASVNGSEIAPLAGSAGAQSASLTGSAAVVTDETRGDVLQITNEPGAMMVNYLQLPADTLANVTASGYTVAMWVKIAEETFEHSALFEADAGKDYPLTRIGANLIGRINANGSYSDVQGALLSTSGERGVWQHVAYTVDSEGIRVYLNGELVGEEEKDISDCFRSGASIKNATNVMVGSGNIWDDEDVQNACFDNIMIYDGALTADAIRQLYQEG